MKEQTKPMILVVDDLSINRMILRNILSGEYEIDEASNGEEALHKIQSKGADYSLVISDNHMEKMDGLEFLGVMSKNPWLRKIPVIMVSSDKNADFVDKAYALGAADFFFIPFVPSIIRHRVKYTLENYRKHQEELLNSVHIAGEMYFVMMQMDLEKDTCEILDTSEFSDMWDKDISLNATKTIRLFTQYGYIHPDDLDAFLEFTLPSRLKELFLSGTVKTHFRYRRKYKDKYYWALMEISRTADYSETNQTVVMVSRDIQEEVDQQKQTMNMVSQNSISTDFCNITRNFFYHDERASYVNETVREFDTITQMIEWGAEKMSNEKERKQFLETFDRENLIRLFASGHKTAGCEHFYRTPETGLKRFRTSVQMFRNVHTKDVEGIYYVEDIGQEFIHRQVAENLYYQEYIFVGIWDTKYGDIYIHKTGKDMFQKDAERVPYQEIVDYRLGKQSLSLEDYRQKTSKEYVLRQLDNFKTSSFTFDSVTDEGRPCTLEYVYRYFDEENGLVAVLVRNITDSVETDNVTQAMNQKGFVREVEWYLRENPNNDYAILYFNIREFKAINEVLGYEKGNALLQFTQDYLSTSELQPIFTARIMADQFACLVKRECITDERMRKACRTEIKEEDLPLVLRMNCGIYHVEENETNVRGMLDKAKMTLSVIKNEFTSPYATFEKELQDSYVKQMMIMNDIPNALGRGEFVVYYQPIFDAKTERMVSAEALLRWKTKERGMISPAEFIPVAEEKGIISQLDEFVANDVNRFMKKRIEENRYYVPVSINLSRMDFYNPNMLEGLLVMMDSSKVDNRYFRYEITESSFTDVNQLNDWILPQMRERGNKILIDDFGTGYSSLANIVKQDFNLLKIDMSFVRNIGKSAKNEAVIQAIIDMAHHMNTTVVAEGVETLAQLEFLRENNCDCIQGYYFSKPLSEEEFIQRLDQAKEEL